MKKTTNTQKEVWSTILLFLAIVFLLSFCAHYAIVKLNPSSIYVGALMMTPTLAAFITLKIKGRSLASLPWRLNNKKYLIRSYLTPVAYIAIAYTAIWLLGYGSIINEETIGKWAGKLGLDPNNTILVALLMIFLLATVGVVKNMGSVLGEEIGWRGFFIYELRKVVSFRVVAIASGLIWALWHWPLIVYYGGGDTGLQLTAFTIMIIAMSVILAYFTFKSNSLWPAGVFHSVHNIYIQKIATPITIYNENTSFWIDEYGFMLPIVTSLFAIYYWRKAKKEGL